ncbi:MAG: rod shape-determining protein [Rickettsiales bacterium]|jgi:cell division protein FtsA|nr:rod shape-determining protein [Rickettsiales bacterium]
MNGGPLAFLDIGQTHVRAAAAHGGRILAASEAPNAGNEAAAVNAAIAQIESKIDERLSDAIVIVSGHVRSRAAKAQTDFRRTRTVTEEDIIKTIRKAPTGELDSESLLHVIPLKYSAHPGDIDGGVAALVHIVSMPSDERERIHALIRKCNLNPVRLVSSAYAEGAGRAIKDGAIADIGAGGMRVGLFAKGKFVSGFCTGLGGDAVTNFIAQKLGIGTAEAEALKLKYGARAPQGFDFSAQIALATPDGGERIVPKSEILQASNLAMSAIAHKMRERIEQMEDGALAGLLCDIIITGGGALIGGGAKILGGRPEAQRKLEGAVRLYSKRTGTGAETAAPRHMTRAAAGVKKIIAYVRRSGVK